MSGDRIAAVGDADTLPASRMRLLFRHRNAHPGTEAPMLMGLMRTTGED